MTALPRGPFLAALAAVLSGCAIPRSPSGGPGASPAAPASDDVRRFLALSERLTGYGDLDPAAGAAYLADLRADPQRSAALDRLLAQNAGFEDAAVLSVATQILENWYAGTSLGPNGVHTVTWTGALAWRACSYTKPPSLCAAPGSWAQVPAS